LLACGCFVGVYETYSGETVEIVEERGPRCTDLSHEDGRATRKPAQPPRRSEQHVA